MTTVWRFLKVFTLGTWVGSMIFFGFVAGVLFSQLKNIDEAGNIVAVLILQLHLLGIIAAVIYLAVALIAARSWRGLVTPAAILVELMLLVTLVSQLWIMPTMQNLRTQMGSYMNTAANNPLRQQFDHLHVISVRLEAAVLVAGIVALFLTVWQRSRTPDSGSTISSTAPPQRTL
jgi:polyferredoxin